MTADEMKGETMTDTPLTDALEAGIKVRAWRRGLNMPEDYQDAMEIARRLERALAGAEEQLSLIANFTSGYADVAGIVNVRARAAAKETKHG